MPAPGPRFRSSRASPSQSRSPILRGLGIKPTYQVSSALAQFRERLDADLDPEQMGNPAPSFLCQRGRSPLSTGEIERQVELVAALPVAVGVFLAENIDLHRCRPNIDISDNTGVGSARQ